MFHVNVVLLTYVWVLCLVPYVCLMRFTNHCLIYFSSSFQPTNLETTRDGRHSSESSYRLEDHWSNITREYLDILKTSHFGTVVLNVQSLVFRFFECWNYVLYRMFKLGTLSFVLVTLMYGSNFLLLNYVYFCILSL